MFVITEMEDNVEIRAAAVNKRASIEEQLRKKYLNKLVGDLGQAIAIHSIANIASYEIHNHLLIVHVTFQILFYRFYPEEVCNGKIVKQDEEGMVLEDDVFSHYVVHPEYLFEDCEYLKEGEKGHWVWYYKGNSLVFYDFSLVRFRIRGGMEQENLAILVSMNEQGLGPCSWWD